MPIRAARRWLAAAAAVAAAAVHARVAPPPEVAAELPGARTQGEGQMRFFGLRVYDARLWAGEPASATTWPALPLALEIEYARDFAGAAIAERSLKEMQRQAEIATDTGARWLDAMMRLFPDVRAGDRITGVHRPGTGARFFVNGRLQGELPDADFARLFFGIWLSPRTSEPALREALLGPGAR
ncbi:MAG: chalcone isomerase family protein [Betaproteobacteria bacterium]|nr:chalcone isomerase family protein [Betaproteobacteria bacterium]